MANMFDYNGDGKFDAVDFALTLNVLRELSEELDELNTLYFGSDNDDFEDEDDFDADEFEDDDFDDMDFDDDDF